MCEWFTIFCLEVRELFNVQECTMVLSDGEALLKDKRSVMCKVKIKQSIWEQ